MAVSVAVCEIFIKEWWPWNPGYGSFKVIENGTIW